MACSEQCRQYAPFIGIDESADKDHDFVVRRGFSLMLLLGALLGLLAQEVALASAPAIPMHDMAVSSSAMSDECAEMMGVDTPQPDKPCKGLTLDCIAKMGCPLPMVVVTPAAPLAIADYRREPVHPLAVQRLVGRSFGPLPDPPLIFG